MGRKHQRFTIATAQKKSEWIPYLLPVNNHSSKSDYFQEIGPLQCQRKTIWLQKVTEEKIRRISSMTASRNPRNVLRQRKPSVMRRFEQIQNGFSWQECAKHTPHRDNPVSVSLHLNSMLCRCQRSPGDGRRSRRSPSVFGDWAQMLPLETFKERAQRREGKDQSAKAQTLMSPQMKMNSESSHFYQEKMDKKPFGISIRCHLKTRENHV